MGAGEFYIHNPDSVVTLPGKVEIYNFPARSLTPGFRRSLGREMRNMRGDTFGNLSPDDLTAIYAYQYMNIFDENCDWALLRRSGVIKGFDMEYHGENYWRSHLNGDRQAVLSLFERRLANVGKSGGRQAFALNSAQFSHAQIVDKLRRHSLVLKHDTEKPEIDHVLVYRLANTRAAYLAARPNVQASIEAAPWPDEINPQIEWLQGESDAAEIKAFLDGISEYHSFHEGDLLAGKVQIAGVRDWNGKIVGTAGIRKGPVDPDVPRVVLLTELGVAAPFRGKEYQAAVAKRLRQATLDDVYLNEDRTYESAVAVSEVTDLQVARFVWWFGAHWVPDSTTNWFVAQQATPVNDGVTILDK